MPIDLMVIRNSNNISYVYHLLNKIHIQGDYITVQEIFTPNFHKNSQPFVSEFHKNLEEKISGKSRI